MLNDLLLLSGNDIPFEEAQLTIHQPTVKEIAYVGEETFYTGCEFLNFSKDNLEQEDRTILEHLTNFDVLMSIIEEQNITAKKGKLCIYLVLSLLFPQAMVTIEKNQIKIVTIGEEESEHFITNKNFDQFVKIINEMFCLKQNQEDKYNPSGKLAADIANKLKKRHQKLAEDSEKPKKIAIISRYVSVLTVGEQKDMNSFMQYTVYQLFDEFKRYELKVNNDIYFQAKLAGAKDLKEVDDWMQDIHP
jgi:hypothetical protein